MHEMNLPSSTPELLNPTEILKDQLATALLTGALNDVADCLNRGASPNGEPGAVMTPLTMSFITCMTHDKCKLLIESGADVNHKAAEVGNVALSGAVNLGRIELIQYLVSKGVDIDARNEFGHTPLMQAALTGRLTPVVTLLKAGANYLLKGPDGRTAEQMAIDKAEEAAAINSRSAMKKEVTASFIQKYAAEHFLRDHETVPGKVPNTTVWVAKGIYQGSTFKILQDKETSMAKKLPGVFGPGRT